MKYTITIPQTEWRRFSSPGTDIDIEVTAKPATDSLESAAVKALDAVAAYRRERQYKLHKARVAKNCQIARMLKDGYSYEQIETALATSPKKISEINQILNA